ncbi:hypothetical protein [Acetobacter sp. AAB5]|uniref:hypothetical protein n=1 Tax=Acetobacter sp. AAB5 TaxID=3418370 RepID=UPI003CE96037
MSAKTLVHMRISYPQLCEPLRDTAWYDMTSGIRVRLSDPLLLDDGTVELNALFPMRGNALLDHIETLLRCRFHGRGGKTYFRLAEPKNHIISAESFIEATLGSAQRIDTALRRLSEPMTGVPWTVQGAEDLLEIIDAVRDGKMDHSEFSARMAQADYAVGTPGYHQLFARNAHILVEHTRTALIRAFECGNRMMEQVRLLIENKEKRYFGELVAGNEINHASPTAERLHAAFIDGISAVATALDLLYRLFVFLVREPFGHAEMPGRLYFPYNESGKVYAPFPKGAKPLLTDLGAMDLPYAIPNIVPGSFLALRGFRNDLTHNMTSGHIQPICWIGCGTGQVNGTPIRYVLANAPDIDQEGKPLKHAFMERFFSQQRDAAIIYRELMEELALTADHTLQWLANRLEQRILHDVRATAEP